MNKTVTTDVSRSANMEKIDSDVSRIETNHGRAGELIHINKLYDVPSTKICHGKKLR